MSTAQAKAKISLVWNDVLAAVIEAGLNRILLYGPPDTGKTTTASKIRPDGEVYRVQCSRQQGIEDLLGSFLLVPGPTGSPVTQFVPGPIVKAMKEGALLLADEFDMRNPAHDSIWHSVLDDESIAEVRLPDGTVIKPSPGFIAIATTNATPNAFSPALQRRFQLKLFCGQAHPEALNSLKPEHRSIVVNWQKALTPPQIKFELSVSALRTFSILADCYGCADTAARLVFHDGAAEFISALANNQKA